MGIWKGDRVMGMGSLLLGIPLTHSGYPQYYTILNVLISGMDYPKCSNFWDGWEKYLLSGNAKWSTGMGAFLGGANYESRICGYESDQAGVA